MYGEPGLFPGLAVAGGGLSPRVRGTQPPRIGREPTASSIPACTGNPVRLSGFGRVTGVYPRVYGEPSRRVLGENPPPRLSPRVRGTPDLDLLLRASHGSCVYGEPWIPTSLPRPRWVYPRVYGEPRPICGGSRGGLRSIPACTGNPRQTTRLYGPPGVYPRVYGEPACASARVMSATGLSPRVRGTHTLIMDAPASRGSIPACTGNPGLSGTTRAYAGVYPRVYGETRAVARSEPCGQGLPPRVRGNPTYLHSRPPVRRSIPACTGNPPIVGPAGAGRRVYPRVYGETACAAAAAVHGDGLSPRVRGNHASAGHELAPARSIPACTGKPHPTSCQGQARRVYPRVYGETTILRSIAPV